MNETKLDQRLQLGSDDHRRRAQVGSELVDVKRLRTQRSQNRKCEG